MRTLLLGIYQHDGLADLASKAVNKAGEHFIVVILVAIIIAVAGWLWRRGLGGVNRLFKTIPVSGNWKTQIDRGAGFVEHENATLRQLMSRVWGHTTTVTGGRKTYSLRGHITGQMLFLLYRTSDGGGFDSGAIALEISPEGNELSGYEIGFDKESRVIASRKYKWIST